MGTDAFQIRRHNNINVQDSVHPYRGYTQNQLVATVNTNAGNVKEDINIGDPEAKTKHFVNNDKHKSTIIYCCYSSMPVLLPFSTSQ